MTKGYAALASDGDLELFDVPRRDLRPDDVSIDILYCGVCHSDLHEARNDWGFSNYPMVPGHEIVGRVQSVGSGVTSFKPGDLVGVGCYVDSCRECRPCEIGEESYCENWPTATYGSVDRHDGMPTYGGYSKHIVVSDKFVLRVPASLDLKSAGPLLCAGITTYAPLRHWKVGPEHKVAVAGLGGLGHLALKFAKAMGAEVTLFTRSPDKAEEARRLGADHIVISTDEAQMAATANAFDFVIDTIPSAHDLNPYITSLRLDGKLILLGMLEPIDPPLHGGLLMLGRKAVVSSNVGGIRETQDMLDFCAEHGITCDVEMIAMQDINVAFERLRRGDVHYRFVIDMATLGEK
ncbi:putative zinc-type alcohol dehydrogenase-like protein [Sphingobium vermicomposti]|uniref:Putative zinc-type alcohol dehydrogenase-like protein n=2 Tax=Sphingobium vermicomposti TaxID=529005 RepID=A0A846MHU6_9SPHN|nr:putative zinc-type alcohol dehydrogenase-like protein [Sphingobium vermicomposti]